MTGAALTDRQLADFDEHGILSGLDVFSADEASAYRARYEDAAHILQGRNNQKPHLLYQWIDELIRDDRVLDPVRAIHGDDLWCWGTQFFAKDAGGPGYVSWHQDATYWGLSSPDIVTAWVALSPSTSRSGCMRVVPGTHRVQLAHADGSGEDNMLSRRQEVAVDVDEAQVVDVELVPGQMSLHHVLLVHGSDPNRSDDARIGLAIRYLPTSVRPLGGLRMSATLVSGVDRYGWFEPEESPEGDMDPRAVARHAAIVERQLAIVYRGATTGRLIDGQGDGVNDKGGPAG